MSSFPAPTRVAHRSFCQVEGWELVRDATGRAVTHHVTYELGLPDGRLLRTRISHRVNKKTYGINVWRHILREQLDVTEPTFWACVQDGTLPQRGAAPPVAHAVPSDLFHLLVTRVGLPATTVLAMTKDEAIAAATAYWTGSGTFEA